MRLVPRACRHVRDPLVRVLVTTPLLPVMHRHLDRRLLARAHHRHRCLLVLHLVPVALLVEHPVAVSLAVAHPRVVAVAHLLVAVDLAVAVELALLVAADLLVVLVVAVAAVAAADRVVETRAVQLLVLLAVPAVVPPRVASPRSRGVKSSMICRPHLLVA